MTQPESTEPLQGEATHDARAGSGDPETDPAAMGEQSFARPDGDGGAVADESGPASP